LNTLLEALLQSLSVYLPRLAAALVILALAWLLVRAIESILYRLTRIIEKAYVARLVDFVKVVVYGAAALIAVAIIVPEATVLPVIIVVIGIGLVVMFMDMLRSLGAELYVRLLGVVRRGDWIEVDGVLVRVVSMESLGVIGETPRMERVFIPYSKLISSMVINRSTPLGLSVKVRVVAPAKYGVEIVRNAVVDAVKAVAEDLVAEPHIALTALKSDSVEFTVEMHIMNYRKLSAVLEEITRRVREVIPDAVIEA